MRFGSNKPARAGSGFEHGRRLFPGWSIVVLDVLALGAALVIFSLFHHVIPRDGGGPKLSIVDVSIPAAARSETEMEPPEGLTAEESAALISAPALSPAPKPAPRLANTPEPTPAPTAPPPGDFSSVFPDWDTGVRSPLSYQSDNVRIAVRQVQEARVTYYIADVWIKNIASLRTAFAKDRYGQGVSDNFMKIFNQTNAILAITGDYYGARAKGIVIRNGDLYRDSVMEDVCVLYQDGVMETYSKEEFSLDEAIARKAYQAWSFGPMLLDGGKPIEKFNSAAKGVSGANPRTAIGYFEPGHYCFVTVDGRQGGYSRGMTLKELSQLFSVLGCRAAYNLDGGQTAMMAFEGEYVNRPYNGGRNLSDIVYIED